MKKEPYHLNTKQPIEEVIGDLTHATKNNWMDPVNKIMSIKKLLQAEYDKGYKDGFKAGQEDLV